MWQGSKYVSVVCNMLVKTCLKILTDWFHKLSYPKLSLSYTPSYPKQYSIKNG